METEAMARRLLGSEARALLTRVNGLEPFSLHMPMVMAAAITIPAQRAIERHLVVKRQELRAMVKRFLAWVDSAQASPSELQAKWCLVKMRFNSIISQFDIFADVLSQRSEHGTGVWVSGLDALARDSLTVPGLFDPPPVICYLDRGHGAAIRRARTRLPGGDENPVAVIQVPRERMVGSGIGSSLIHEAGHQAAAILGLVDSLRRELDGEIARTRHPRAWALWRRWISEIAADFWSVGQLGIASTYGLISVVSLPRAFMFNLEEEDPHPTPWVRVRLSCAVGKSLYPHTQWDRLLALWKNLYPPNLAAGPAALLAEIEASLPRFTSLLLAHRNPGLGGMSLSGIMPLAERTPDKLQRLYRHWLPDLDRMRSVPPTLAFAGLGQARADGALGADEESAMFSRLLTYWAWQGSMDSLDACSVPLKERLPRPRQNGALVLNSLNP